MENWPRIWFRFFTNFWLWVRIRVRKKRRIQLQSTPWIRIRFHLWCEPEMSGLWNFSIRVQSRSDKIETDPVLVCQIFENHQSDPVLVRQWKIMYFYFVSWGKKLLELFCLYTNTIGWRQNSSSSAFASWGKMYTAFCHFQNLTRKCLFGIRGKSIAGLILLLGESDCLDWSSDRTIWISVRFSLHDKDLA